MKKKWIKPELNDLELRNTKEEGDMVCPYVESGIMVITPIPNGPQGVENCRWWKGDGCTHKNYGKGNSKNWPCKKSTTQPSDPIPSNS